MKITLEINERVTDWLGLDVDVPEITLGFEYGYEPADENGNHEQWEFYDFTYICNEGKEWELDKTLIAPGWLKQQLITTVENYYED